MNAEGRQIRSKGLGRRTFLFGAVASTIVVRTAGAQGFAGLASTADGFALPYPGYQFSFPSDQGPHPDFRIEWWYVTATLNGADGRDYGIQWTLFRNALSPGEAEGLDSPQVWLGHFGLTTPDQHFSAQRYGRGGIGQAGVVADPFAAWIDDWDMTATGTGYRLRAAAKGVGYDLDLVSRGPRVFHGDAGYSEKSGEGQASYYYSEPFLELTGALTLPGGPMQVTGQAWIDREWSSQPLSDDQIGWDWFSLSFDSGDKLMGFHLRSTSGAAYTSASWIAADGATTAYPDGAFSVTPGQTAMIGDKTLPIEWRVILPDRGLDVSVTAVNEAAWMDLDIAYWEGPVRISGSHGGRGYLEMTGY